VFGALEGLLIAVGVITNPGVSSALFHLGLGQSVTAVGIVSGLALGALGGFLDVLSGLWSFRTSEIFIPFLAGAVIAGMILLNVAAFERLGLRIRGYRRLSRDEVRRVAPLVKQVADAMELPALPRFAMADTVVPNAWTHMRASRHSCGRATRKVERSRLVRPGIFVVLQKLMGRVRFRHMWGPFWEGGHSRTPSPRVRALRAPLQAA